MERLSNSPKTAQSSGRAKEGTNTGLCLLCPVMGTPVMVSSQAVLTLRQAFPDMLSVC